MESHILDDLFSIVTLVYTGIELELIWALGGLEPDIHVADCLAVARRGVLSLHGREKALSPCRTEYLTPDHGTERNLISDGGLACSRPAIRIAQPDIFLDLMRSTTVLAASLAWSWPTSPLATFRASPISLRPSPFPLTWLWAEMRWVFTTVPDPILGVVRRVPVLLGGLGDHQQPRLELVVKSVKVSPLGGGSELDLAGIFFVYKTERSVGSPPTRLYGGLHLGQGNHNNE